MGGVEGNLFSKAKTRLHGEPCVYYYLSLFIDSYNFRMILTNCSVPLDA